MRGARWSALALVLALAACEPPRLAAPLKEDMARLTLTLQVAIDGDGTDALTVRCTVHNGTTSPVHVFDSPRLPYLLDEDGTLVVLHGLHAAPADRDYNVIEIPLTRPLAAGETLTFAQALIPLALHGHYEDSPAVPRHGAVPVACRLGHLATAITAADQRKLSINKLLGRQDLLSSDPVVVHFP